MWYPLNKSIHLLSLISLVLFVLLAVGRPVAEPASSAMSPAQVEHALEQTVSVFNRHLFIEDPAQRRQVTLALRTAAAALSAQLNAQRMAKASEANAARRQLRRATMPYFSFAAMIPRSVEPGA